MIISWRYTAKEMLANRARLYLTLLALACGTAAITFMLSVGQGLRVQYLKTTDLGKANLPISGGVTTLPYRGTSAGTPILLTSDDATILKNKIPQIQDIVLSHSVSQTITYRDKSVRSSYFNSIKAVSPSYGDMRHITIKPGGRFLNELDNAQARPTIVLGDKLAGQLFKIYENPLGKVVQLGGKPFTVIGVTQPNQTTSDAFSSESNGAWIPVATYETLVPHAKDPRLTVIPRSIDQIPQIKTQIQAVMALYHQFDPKDTTAINIEDKNERYQGRVKLLLGLQILLGTIGGITLAMASVSVANVMFTAIDSATRDIGIKIAIGAQRYHIITYYLFEALLVTAIGGLLGIVAALLLSWGYNSLPAHPLFGPLRDLGRVRAEPSLTVLLTVIVVLGLVGFLAGFFPARKAASIDPVEALKHE